MTEAEWLKATDPRRMLEFVRGKTTDRKLRLFTVGCCYLMWDWLVYPQSRQAVLASEAFADGIGSDSDLVTHNFKAEGAVFAIDDKKERYRREQHGVVQGWIPEEDRIEDTGFLCANGKRISFDSARMAADAAECSTSSVNEFLTRTHPALLSEPLVRCIFGNPFHSTDTNPSWLTSDVLALATGIYADRAFDRIPILADALQDAGCDNADILTHCRQPGEHVRGCWVVDLVLGKS